jgi:hypothetical protein
MNFLGVHVYPGLLEESWRDLERERRQATRMRAARRRPTVAGLSPVARLLRGARPCPPAVEVC